MRSQQWSRARVNQRLLCTVTRRSRSLSARIPVPPKHWRCGQRQRGKFEEESRRGTGVAAAVGILETPGNQPYTLPTLNAHENKGSTVSVEANLLIDGCVPGVTKVNLH